MDTRRAEAIKQKEHLEALTAHPGWHILLGVLEAQVKLRMDEVILAPTGEVNTPFQQEFKKGEITGIRTVLETPQMLIEAATDIAGMLKHDNEAGSDDSSE